MLPAFLPDGPHLAAFLTASLILAITPGPGVAYIVARSLTQGRHAGLASVAGVALGNLGNALAAAVGLAAVFAVSALAFTVVKIAGALYLVWLGVQMLRAPAPIPAEVSRVPVQRIFRDGFAVALLNPKTTLFFAAFLPQFMRTDTAALPQSIVLGALFVIIAGVTDTLYALAAGTLAPTLGRLHSGQVLGRRIIGSLFIGLGLFAALTGSRNR